MSPLLLSTQKKTKKKEEEERGKDRKRQVLPANKSARLDERLTLHLKLIS